MKCFAHRCNTVEKVEKALGKGYNHIKIDVSLSTTGKINVSHDLKDINNPNNCTIDDIIDNSKNCEIMIDIKARGIDQGVEMARKVVDCIHKYKNSFMLCSFNEYCVNECIELRDQLNLKYKVGVISCGIPLGMFKHLNIDFVSLEYSFLFKGIEMYLDNNIEIYAFTVNTIHSKNYCKYISVDGIIYDI